ncbi:hypothetical protein DFH29DRAFT_444151 [Suillus ampliporus]|nr:hypothetical protein DFH29DRAFT_444151 [Suillus ampliporus]
MTLRCTRVVFLILKQFSFELETEAEVLLMLLIRMISEESDTANPDHSGSRPVWTRVLAMETMRGVCSDADLVRNIWDRSPLILSSLIPLLASPGGSPSRDPRGRMDSTRLTCRCHHVKAAEGSHSPYLGPLVRSSELSRASESIISV